MSIVMIFMMMLSIRTETIAGVKVVPPNQGMYHCAFPYFGPLEDRVSAGTIHKFETLVGKRIAWAYFSNNWFRGIRFPASSVRTIYRTGSIPFIRMMARTSFSKYDTAYTLQKIINGRFDIDLIRWAKNARRTGIPMMVEFGGEMNGDWFPWSGVLNGGGTTSGYGDPTVADGPERFRDAYRHIIDLFRMQDVQNITWVIHYNAGSSPRTAWNTMAAYYPGDDYIDWIGESAYGAQIPGQDWQMLSDVLDNSYTELSSISPTRPLAILEYGVIDDSISNHKSSWIRSALDSLKAGRYSRIKSVCYWHSKFANLDGSISNMRLDSSPEVVATYRAEIVDPFFVSTPQFSAEVPSIAEFLRLFPDEFVLQQNYPNPFNPTTTIQFQLPVPSIVTLKIYAITGKEVGTLLDREDLSDGEHELEFNASGFASGVYFYRIVAESPPDEHQSSRNTFVNMKKMILLK